MEMRVVVNAIGKWLRENVVMALYFLFAVLLEMAAVFVVEGSPFISRPLIGLGLLIALTALVSLIKQEWLRLFIYSVLLIAQVVVDLVFSVIFDMTEQYFDFGMFSLRNDAFGILESVPMNFFMFYIGLVVCVFFILYGMRKVSGKGVKKRTRWAVARRAVAVGLGLVISCGAVYVYAPKDKTSKYDEMLTGGGTGAYSSYGMVGNFINEVATGTILRNKTQPTSEEIEDFIYKEISQPTKYFGVSADNNVVVVLVESLEWFSFLKVGQYPFEMPNSLRLSDESIERLFPNLSAFYDSSVVATNFHSREKTDISETLSIMGAYPTGAYINYDYEKNTLPHTLPNMLKEFFDVQTSSYHNGWKDFYNRDKAHYALGFGEITATGDKKYSSPMDMYDMLEESKQSGKNTFTDYYNGELSERNLDSEMIETCKDFMFPVSGRFYTYITTITMHGMYYPRTNLTEKGYWHALLKECFPAEYEKGVAAAENAYKKMGEEAQTLFNYATTVMEFDVALGKMIEDLKEKNLYENTTIVLFGDHNTYYQNLSNYTKDISGYETPRYFTDLYGVPLMIYDPAIQPQKVDKFTCTADIMPTLMDMLGLRYFSNLYYGRSIFDPTPSTLYSRAYGTFIGDGVVGRSLAHDVYCYRGKTAEERQQREEYLRLYRYEGEKLVQKIRYCDGIFKSDYFAKTGKKELFLQQMRTINGA